MPYFIYPVYDPDTDPKYVDYLPNYYDLNRIDGNIT